MVAGEATVVVAEGAMGVWTAGLKGGLMVEVTVGLKGVSKAVR